MKLRLIMRNGIADSDGRLAHYDYKTYIVLLDEHAFQKDERPEIIGGEWLDDVSKMPE
jgi:hypothetical protein